MRAVALLSTAAMVCAACQAHEREHVATPPPAPALGVGAADAGVGDAAVHGKVEPADAATAQASGPDVDAAASRPRTPWTAAAADSTQLVFRDLLVGMLPYPSRRSTWTLVRGSDALRLRLSSQSASGAIPNVDATSQRSETWRHTFRTEYAGPPVPASGAFKVTLRLVFGPEGDGGPTPERFRTQVADTLELDCRVQGIRVHAATATLKPGGKHGNDEVGRGIWAPPATELASATVCTASGDPSPLLYPRNVMAFVPSRPQAAGVEWAFANNDMVMQEGGYRWIPPGSVE